MVAGGLVVNTHLVVVTGSSVCARFGFGSVCVVDYEEEKHADPSQMLVCLLPMQSLNFHILCSFTPSWPGRANHSATYKRRCDLQ